MPIFLIYQKINFFSFIDKNIFIYCTTYFITPIYFK